MGNFKFISVYNILGAAFGIASTVYIWCTGGLEPSVGGIKLTVFLMFLTLGLAGLIRPARPILYFNLVLLALGIPVLQLDSYAYELVNGFKISILFPLDPLHQKAGIDFGLSNIQLSAQASTIHWPSGPRIGINAVPFIAALLLLIQYKNNPAHLYWAGIAIKSVLTSVLFCLASSFTSWIHQAFIDPIIYLVLPGFLLKQKYDRRALIIFLIPLLIVYVIPSIWLEAGQTLPISILTLSGLFAGYFLHKKNYGLKSYVLFMAILALLAFGGMPNWLNYYFSPSPYCFRDLPKELSFTDLNGYPTGPGEPGKMRILSFWSTSCGACIKEFPDFQNFYNEYKNDTTLSIYSVNMNSAKDPVDAREYLSRKGFNFPCLYMPGLSDRTALGIQLIPALIIIDKNNKIRYFGRFNNKWYHFIHHIEDVVGNIKNNPS